MSPLRAAAPAKLNLALAVTGRREDGYHTLRSIFVRLALHDDLQVEPREDPRDVDAIVIHGDPTGPTDDDLVLRAAAELRRVVGQPLPALRFRLDKRIRMQAGLAGGSSDAAAALDLAAEVWGLRLHPAERLQAALRLGADVPFFAAAHPAALVSGIGEGLERLPALDPPAGLLLVTPNEGLSTAAVFAELDRVPPPGDAAAQRVDALAAAMRAGVSGAYLSGYAHQLRDANDLWPPAHRLAPWLEHMRDALESSMGRPFLLTGSGTTLFAVFPSASEADEAAGRFDFERPAAVERATVVATMTARQKPDDTGGT